ncbi:hypothetical protein NAEGRDRAFT_81977 [Naegleria gruberi]|uniref:DUF4476 domain-containing protein n=1 Tax=Naegleria gruberi TaxID=5762 RepID=D2W0Y7_NAEGR|nr:uncharacterized protein NAEGRDRAFT_81977 [Naegleria gruberi]EFC37224.1 hypothetical protein NAEGRDRAFT_81977 [Naegleria gruberi]|eukprot:XP_002669968.1 hypothetical protein NAEGRDRAFT_81977 [Naegleria gruberi strain NEG-M]
MVNLKILDYICCCFVSHADERSEVPFSQLSNPSPNTERSSDLNDTTDDFCESSEMIIGLSAEQYEVLLNQVQHEIDFDDEKMNHITAYLTEKNVCIDTEQALAFIGTIHFSNTRIVFIERLLPFIIDLKVGKKKIIETIGFYNDKIKIKKLISEHLKKRKIGDNFMKPPPVSPSQARMNALGGYKGTTSDYLVGGTELESFGSKQIKQSSSTSRSASPSPNYQANNK